jgi:hypothetical protein
MWQWLWNYFHRWYYYRDHLNCILLPRSTYFIRQFLIFVLFVGYSFGEIMCIRDSYVYQKGVLCFLIRESYVRSVKSYCFVRKYAAVPVQLEIFILQYIGWCVLIVWTFVSNQFSCVCQFLIIIIIIIIIIRYIIFQLVKFFYLSSYEMLPNTLNCCQLDIISTSYRRRNYASDIFYHPSYFVGDYFVVTYFLPMLCHLLQQ